jgi:CheY-like chemotaxis protein
MTVAHDTLIVVADKDPYDLDAMSATLAGPGRRLVLMHDGREIIAFCAKEHPDAVIAAASLGQMGGFAVSRELRMLSDGARAQPAPKIAVLLERADDAWLAAWSRCDAFRVKPLDSEDLRGLLAELLGTPVSA